MDFVKKNYEKILLSVVLLGLVGALVFLPVLIGRDQEQQANMSNVVLNPRVVPLPPLDMTPESNVLERLQSPYKLDFSSDNKLFNPVQWQRAVDGSLIKIKTGKEIGPAAVAVTKITPLYLILTLDSIETNELGTRYAVSVERQAALLPSQRGRRQHYGAVGDKNDVFTIAGVNGTPDNPAQLQLVLRLVDTGETAVISKSKPFRRVDGYMADLKYDPEGKKWQGQRVGSLLKFAGDEYIIVAINQDSVVLSARSNQKKTTLTYSP